MNDPLKLVLLEARRLGDDPTTGLVKLMCAISMSKHPMSIVAASLWHSLNGEPTWESLEEWAAEYINCPENAEHVARLRAHHEELVRTYSAEDRATLAEHLPEAFQ